MLYRLALSAALLATTPAFAATCPAPGQWIDAAGSPVSASAVLDKALAAQTVLLGERHATPAHHQWQADTIAALAAKGPVVIGLEQLPREAQPALDRWVAGELDEAAFLSESKWAERWGHDFTAYRPVFELARARKIPMKALNVDRAFVRKVGREGFDKAAADGKSPISKPAAADPAYAAKLADTFREHMREASPEAIARFIDAQQVWDRAMAEAIVTALRDNPGAHVAAIMGWGHVADGHGVAHQLKALGAPLVLTAIPVKPGEGCEPKAGAADLLFGAE
ncbi:ChaN family lipoprotein [Sandaracinobacter neustonicus]|nr:ChaN family lipoprotein [Sandaracinobacter neustonicus]